MAKKLGLKLRFENTSFDTIIPGIDGGRFDSQLPAQREENPATRTATHPRWASPL
ncbi:hypothetical protein [Pseudarthrobacter sp. NIBRBAC000502772]|uniref:hypothetical protein n=1 Tax=Pseudarthrobacter sp. NIBRBAC000502772 TaxID=2590775 RepID=UPI00352F7ED0